MAVNLSPVGGVAAQFFDNAGNVLTGGKLQTYLAGTTTPQPAYTSSSGTTPWSNPIILDAAGRVSGSGEIWLTDGIQYKFILRDSNDVLIATYDNIVGINSNFVAFTNQQEIQTATAGQTVFNLTTTQYLPGTNSLSVFVDGVNQYGPGAQYAYIETDADTVTFISGLHVGALVKFTTSQLNSSGGVDAEQVSYTPPFVNSTPTNVEARLAQYISVKDFGAVGDGVTDDTTAITNAEAAALFNGRELVFPNGEYIFDGQLDCNVSISGYGATLKQKATSDTLDAVIKYTSVDNITVRGLTIDGNNVSRGLLFDGCDNVKIIDVKVQNVGFGGIAVYLGANVSATDCFVDGVKFITVGSLQTAADGFYFGSCENVRVVNCFATNFERIGFVTEGTVSDKSRFVKYANCHASNASNSDTTLTEFNAGFWHENSHNVDYVNCSALNMATNVGQTNGRVCGFVGGGEESLVCSHNYVNCYVDNDTHDVNQGWLVNGTSNFPSYSLVNCGVRKCTIGLNSIGGVDFLNINNFKITLLNATANAGKGGLVFDISTRGINSLNIENFNVASGTYHVDAADVNFFTTNSNLRYVLTNSGDLKHIMRQPAASISVTNTSVQYGSASYASFAAVQTKFGENFVGYLRTGAVTKRLIAELVTTNSLVYFDNNAELTSFTSTPTMIPITGAAVNIFANGAKFSWTGFEIALTGTFTHQISNCLVTQVPPTNGFYKANASSTAGHTLMVTGNRFISGNVADTPFVKSTNNPTNSVFQANTFTATNLYNFDGGVTQANNTNV
jgi:hypothetical protein